MGKITAPRVTAFRLIRSSPRRNSAKKWGIKNKQSVNQLAPFCGACSSFFLFWLFFYFLFLNYVRKIISYVCLLFLSWALVNWPGVCVWSVLCVYVCVC